MFSRRNTTEISTSGLWAAALLTKDDDPAFSRRLLGQIRSRSDYTSRHYAQAIAEEIAQTLPPFRLHADWEVIDFLGVLCADYVIGDFVLADPLNPYPVGYLLKSEESGRTFRMCCEARRPGEKGPRALSSRFMLTDGMREALQKLTREQPSVRMASDGSGAIELADEATAAFFMKVGDGKPCGAKLFRCVKEDEREICAVRDAPIGKATVRPVSDGKLLIVPEASALMEIASMGFSGGMLGFETKEADFSKPLGRNVREYFWTYGQNGRDGSSFRAIFAAPNLADIGEPSPAWTPATRRLLTTTAPCTHAVAVDPDLALEAVERFWWLADAKDAAVLAYLRKKRP